MYQEKQSSSQSQTSQSSYRSKSFDFHWEKRHWILLIGLACLILWWFAPSLKTMPFLQSTLNLLPAIGGIAFALENIFKLAF